MADTENSIRSELVIVGILQREGQEAPRPMHVPLSSEKEEKDNFKKEPAEGTKKRKAVTFKLDLDQEQVEAFKSLIQSKKYKTIQAERADATFEGSDSLQEAHSSEQKLTSDTSRARFDTAINQLDIMQDGVEAEGLDPMKTFVSLSFEDVDLESKMLGFSSAVGLLKVCPGVASQSLRRLFLGVVAKGERDAAEAMLQKHPDLVFASGTI